MTEAMHAARINDILSRLQETSVRFTSRLESAGDRAEHAVTGWTPAQIAAHVAMVNHNLAAVIEGSRPAAAPPAADFRERDWADVVRDVPAKNEAPARFQPPAQVASAEAIAQFRDSVAHLARAIAALPSDRARYCIHNRVVGTITLYQAGDFAIAHMIRHNQQLKRVLGG